MSKTQKIAVVGAGGIGRAVALIMAEWSEISTEIYIGDAYEQTALDAAKWIKEGCTQETTIHAFTMPFEGVNDAFQNALTECDIVLDCLPGSQAPRIAQLAKDNHLHYANLTEYVAETNKITDIAKDASTGFILQTGLAPGFVNVVANGLYQQFVEKYGVEQVEYLGMKVGALTQNACAPHFYGFTWSPVGVATEYIKDAIVVRDFETTTAISLSERETLIIDGRTYEADLTSGGAADMPDALAGKVKDLDYKTIRYVGHYDWAMKQLSNLGNSPSKIQDFQDLMELNIPHIEEDMVVLHCNVIGFDKNKVLRSLEKVFHVFPQKVGKHTLRAIQTTTAVPLAESARMLLTGNLKGVIFQSQLNPVEFMNGQYTAKVYK